jgi:hypothetical protein
MDERARLLLQLAEFSAEPRDILAKLSKYPWDPPSTGPLLLLTREHFRSALNRYLRGEITAEQLEDWAGSLECREDIGFDSRWEAVLMDLEYRLASPEINEAITPKLAAAMLTELSDPAGTFP